MRAGYGVMIAGMLYLAWQLHRKGSSRSLPEEMGLASAWSSSEGTRTTAGPGAERLVVVPGAADSRLGAVDGGDGAGQSRPPAPIGPVLGVLNLVAALAFVFVWKLNQWAAGKLQRQIDELDTLRER